MKIVHETEPGKFARFSGGTVRRAETGAVRRTHWHDDRPDLVETIEVEPYEIEVKVVLAVALAWDDKERADHGLYAVEDFVTPEGKRRVGEARYERVDGVVVETYDVEDQPPEPTADEVAEQKIADLGFNDPLVLEKLAARLKLQEPKEIAATEEEILGAMIDNS